MKKLVLLIGCLLLSISLFSQVADKENADGTMTYGTVMSDTTAAIIMYVEDDLSVVADTCDMILAAKQSYPFQYVAAGENGERAKTYRPMWYVVKAILSDNRELILEDRLFIYRALPKAQK